MLDLRIDFENVVDAAQVAAQLALKSWNQGSPPNAEIWEKAPGNPVCAIDLAVDEMLKKSLSGICPQAAWLSEETVDNSERQCASLVWMVDPIDGTRDYVRGRDGWCISIALVADNMPVFAVMVAPTRDQLWVAHYGGGATCNGVKLSAGNRTELSGARVPTDALPQIDKDLVIVDKPNSIAMRMTMLACDKADLVATIRWGHEWDIAAAYLVASEAGATVTNALGESMRFNKPDPRDFGMVAAVPGIHSAAVERLRERATALGHM